MVAALNFPNLESPVHDWEARAEEVVEKKLAGSKPLAKRVCVVVTDTSRGRISIPLIAQPKNYIPDSDIDEGRG